MALDRDTAQSLGVRDQRSIKIGGATKNTPIFQRFFRRNQKETATGRWRLVTLTTVHQVPAEQRTSLPHPWTTHRGEVRIWRNHGRSTPSRARSGESRRVATIVGGARHRTADGGGVGPAVATAAGSRCSRRSLRLVDAPGVHRARRPHASVLRRAGERRHRVAAGGRGVGRGVQRDQLQHGRPLPLRDPSRCRFPHRAGPHRTGGSGDIAGRCGRTRRAGGSGGLQPGGVRRGCERDHAVRAHLPGLLHADVGGERHDGNSGPDHPLVRRCPTSRI